LVGIPELATGVKGPETKTESVSDSQGMLSQKLDAMLKMLDGELMSSLGNSIKILISCKILLNC
jgi:hypothetical protein